MTGIRWEGPTLDLWARPEAWPPEDRREKPRTKSVVLVYVNIAIAVAAFVALSKGGSAGRILFGVAVVYEVLFHSLLVLVDRSTHAAHRAGVQKDAAASAAAAKRCELAYRLTAVMPPLRWSSGASLQWWWGTALCFAGDDAAGVARAAPVLERSADIFWWSFRQVGNAERLMAAQIRLGDLDGARRTVEIGARATAWAPPIECPRILAWRAINLGRIAARAAPPEHANDALEAHLVQVPAEIWHDAPACAAAGLARVEIAHLVDDDERAWQAIPLALTAGSLRSQRVVALKNMTVLALRSRRHDRFAETARALRRSIEAQLDPAPLAREILTAVVGLSTCGDRTTAVWLLATPGPHRALPVWGQLQGYLDQDSTTVDPSALRQRCPAELLADDATARAWTEAHPAEARAAAADIRRLVGADRTVIALGAEPDDDDHRAAWHLAQAELLADGGDLAGSARELDVAIEHFEAARTALEQADHTELGLMRLEALSQHYRGVRCEVAAAAGDLEGVATMRAWFATRELGPDFFVTSAPREQYWDALLDLHAGEPARGRARLDEACDVVDAWAEPTLRPEAGMMWARTARRSGHHGEAAALARVLAPLLRERGYPAFADEVDGWYPSAVAPPD
jgi:hypothetical protein